MSSIRQGDTTPERKPNKATIVLSTNSNFQILSIAIFLPYNSTYKYCVIKNPIPIYLWHTKCYNDKA